MGGEEDVDSGSDVEVGALLERGLACHRSGRLQEADDLYRQILRVDPRQADAHHLLGLTAHSRGDDRAALCHIERAIAEKPDQPAFHTNLGFIYRQLGRRDDAAAACRFAVERDPNSIKGWICLGDLHAESEEMDEAARCYERALAIDPDRVRVLGNLANIHEHFNQIEEAERLARRGVALAPEDVMCHYVLGKCERRAGKLREALQRLERLPIDDDWKDVSFELGQLHDRVNQPRQAIHWFEIANRQARPAFERTGADPQRYVEKIERLQDWFRWENVSSWSRPDGDDAPPSTRRPVFLVGFPRSGTTLLDRILRSHSQVMTLEEQPTLKSIEGWISRTPAGFPAGLNALTREEADALRAEYWRTVDGHVPRVEGQLVIDKLPLDLVNAGLIARLFPRAKFLFALRHPCDVCLSCFMQDFRPNDAMAAFLTLESTVALYARVMQLWEQFRNVLPLGVCTIRYEAVVEDAEAEIRGGLEFLELDWEPTVLEDERRSDPSTLINTPSYHQVTEPIYTRARNRCERYAEYFDPFRSLLEPIVRRYGYGFPGDAAEDGARK